MKVPVELAEEDARPGESLDGVNRHIPWIKETFGSVLYTTRFLKSSTIQNFVRRDKKLSFIDRFHTKHTNIKFLNVLRLFIFWA